MNPKAFPNQGWMIYHYPFKLQPETAGSFVHLHQMYQAFQHLGYEVTLISGWAEERKAAMQQVRERMQAGQRPDFLYIWSPVVPSLSSKNILYPFLDFNFFHWCKRCGIPIGVFYGDVHWRFPQFKNSRAWRRRALLLPLYWLDWLQYVQLADSFFLPSLAMRPALPTQMAVDRIVALHPGCNIVTRPRKPAQTSSTLELLYVGGVTPPLYDLRPLFATVQMTENVHLTLCCRQPEWEIAVTMYPSLPDEKLTIVHLYGEQLQALYNAADIACYLWSPSPYMAFAMPVKIFEALGYALPTITTTGTETARFIEREGVGWVVETPADCRRLLDELRADPARLSAKRRQAENVRHQHTWEVRAQQIAQTLTQQHNTGES